MAAPASDADGPEPPAAKAGEAEGKEEEEKKKQEEKPEKESPSRPGTPKKGKKKPAASGKKKAEEDEEAGPPSLMLLPHKKKKSREKDFVKLKWPTPPAEDPGPKNAEALKDDWSPYIDRAQHDRFFPRRPGSMD